MEPNQNSSGMINGLPPVAHEGNKKIGPIIGVLVIVLLIIIGAFYVFGKKLNTSPTTTDQTQVKSDVPANDTASTQQSASDAAVIQSDLDAQLKDVDYSF